jgi:activator of 2-hydroxyglutaryl-CoA dehydratase
MDMSLEEAVTLAQEGVPRKIAGRCSVFCKSDCTHALNTGEPRKNIAAGLCVMMADKISELIKDVDCKRIAVVGGGTLNTAVITILKTRYDEVLIPAQAAAFEAWGAALWAVDHQCIPFPSTIDAVFLGKAPAFSLHPALSSAQHLVEFKQDVHTSLHCGDECILGLDVGSTTTKAVLLKKSDCSVVASVYLRTNGNPVEASKNCYRALYEQTYPIRYHWIRSYRLGKTNCRTSRFDFRYY